MDTNKIIEKLKIYLEKRDDSRLPSFLVPGQKDSMALIQTLIWKGYDWGKKTSGATTMNPFG
jgi:hypothetical protein